jgi:hypothetical protein
LPLLENRNAEWRVHHIHEPDVTSRRQG